MSPVDNSDLNQLLEAYSNYRSKWYDFGVQLGINAGQLDVIKMDNRDRCDDCFREVLLYWLKNSLYRDESELKRAARKIDQMPASRSIVTSNSLLMVLAIAFLAAAIAYVIVKVYHPTSTLQITAETLRSDYKHYKVATFNLDGSTTVEYLPILMKDQSGHKFQHTEFLSHYTGEPGRLIITGQPGSGKTTLLRHMAKEWAYGSALQSCEILLLVDLGNIQGEERNSISDMLTKSRYTNMEHNNMAKGLYKNNGAGACFLLDDYDELKDKKYVREIMEGNQIQSSFCILTSRSTPEEFKGSETLTIIEILGYNIDNLSDYLPKLLNNVSNYNKIEELWDKDKNMKEMCTLPIYMAMVVYIYKYECSLLMSTITEVYTAFMNVTVKYHDKSSQPRWDTEALWQCIRDGSSHMDELCIAFSTLHQVAYDMLINDKRLFPSKGELVENNINKLSFVRVSSIHGSKSQVEYTFSHKTFLEYFAAIHLTTLSLNEQLAYISIIKHSIFSQDREGVFYFGLIGHLYQDNVSAASPLLQQLMSISYFRLLTATSIDRRFLDTNFCGVVIDSEYLEIPFKEMGWTGRVYVEAIESSFVVNSKLCVWHNADKYEHAKYVGHLNYHSLGNWKTYTIHDSHNFSFTQEVQFSQESLSCMNNEKGTCTPSATPKITSMAYFRYPKDQHFSSCVWNNMQTEYLQIHLLLADQVAEFYISSYRSLKSVVPIHVLTNLYLTIDRCYLQSNTYSHQVFAQEDIIHLTLEGKCENDTEKTILLCQRRGLSHLMIFIYKNTHAEVLINCLHLTKNLLELDVHFIQQVTNRKAIFENLPYTLQTLSLNFNESMDTVTISNNEVLVISDRIRNLPNLSTLLLYDEVSALGVKLLADALTKTNIHTLKLTVSTSDSVIPLTQLTNLMHLQLIWNNHAHKVNEREVLTMITYLQSLTQLKTFELGTTSGLLDSPELVSSIFDTMQAQHIYIHTNIDSAIWKTQIPDGGMMTYYGLRGPKRGNRVHLN